MSIVVAHLYGAMPQEIASGYRVDTSFFQSGSKGMSHGLEFATSSLVAVARKHGVNLPEKLTIHDLRASFATNYLEEHPDRFWRLMELLGHVSPNSTCLYIRSRGKSRLMTMKEARRPRVHRTGLSAMVYNR